MFIGFLEDILDFLAAFHTSFGLCEDASNSGVQLLFKYILNEQ